MSGSQAIEARANTATPSGAEFRATPAGTWRGGMEVLHCRLCGVWEHVPSGAALEISYLRSRLAEFHCPECGSSMGTDHSFECSIGRRNTAAATAETLWREANPEAMQALVAGTAAVVPNEGADAVMDDEAAAQYYAHIDEIRLDKPVSP